MKNYDYWKSFARTGKIDDYLNYIACTRDEGMGDCAQSMEESLGPRKRSSLQGMNSSGSLDTTQGFQ